MSEFEAKAKEFQEDFARLHTEISKVIVGNKDIIDDGTYEKWWNHRG